MPVWMLTGYVLMWPVLVAVVMAIIARGFIREWWEARREGRDII
ncbi:MAG TPA: putative transporter small subunit [Beutenbergiaceae bacterium]|nr:putative transporter small subunit [Beutenbergiaceae bacterium]